LEARWNTRLAAVVELEDEIKALDAAKPTSTLSCAHRVNLMTLGADLERVWFACDVTPATKKKIVRTLIDEVIVKVESEAINFTVRWQGGDHTELSVPKNRSGQHRWTTGADVIELARALARQMPDKLIAAALNRAGKTTGRGNGWTQSRVRSLRNRHGIDVYRDGERQERGEVTLDEAATTLLLSTSSVRRLIQQGMLPAHQFCKGAPWIICVDDLTRDDVVQAANARRLYSPPSGNPSQKSMEI